MSILDTVHILAQWVDPTQAPSTTVWDVGPGLTALAIALVTAIGTAVTVIVNAILAARGRAESQVKIAEVKDITEKTERLVNSNNDKLLAKVESLELSLRERDKTIAQSQARDDVRPNVKVVEEEKK